jgi:hypothetical protein
MKVYVHAVNVNCVQIYKYEVMCPAIAGYHKRQFIHLTMH